MIEALGFVAGGPWAVETAGPPDESGRRWLAGLGPGPVHEDAIGPAAGRAEARLGGPASVHARRSRSPQRGGALRHGPARGARRPRDADRGARSLSRPAQRRARARRPAQARDRRDDRGGASVRRPARLHGLLGKRAAVRGHCGARRLVRPDRRGRPRVRGRSAQIHGRRRAGDLSGSRRVAPHRLRRRAQGGRRGAQRHGASRRGAPAGRARAPALRRRAASGRNAVGQYRRRRPAGFHRDRPRRQSGQPFAGPMPAARPRHPRLGRLRRRDECAADPARRARLCAASPRPAPCLRWRISPSSRSAG